MWTDVTFDLRVYILYNNSEYIYISVNYIFESINYVTWMLII